MIMTVEISMYPFQENYVPPIRSFIDKLAAGAQSRTEVTSAGAHLQVTTFPTCTVLVGEYALIMDVLKDAIAWSHEELGKAVFVTKFIPGYQPDL